MATYRVAVFGKRLDTSYGDLYGGVKEISESKVISKKSLLSVVQEIFVSLSIHRKELERASLDVPPYA